VGARRRRVLAAVFGAILPCAAAMADPMDFGIVYTTNTSPPLLRSATLTYDPAPATPANSPPTLVVSAPVTIATLSKGYAGATPGSGHGVLVTPGGAYFALSAPSNIHAITTSPTTKVAYSIVSLAAATPAPPSPVGSLRLDPGQTEAWALSRGSATGPAGSTRIAIVPMVNPPQPGLSYQVTGADPIVHDVCFVSGKVYYVAPGSGGGGGSVGVIDPVTFTTTRLITGLSAAAQPSDPSARCATLINDPLTGDLFLIGNDRVTQLSNTGTPGAPVLSVKSEKVLSGVVPGVSLRAGTLDGLGRLIALSSTGHVVLIDYAASGLVGQGSNAVTVAAFDGAANNIVPLSGAGALKTGEKIWDNGVFDQRNGQLSLSSPTTGESRTGDDFALDAGGVYRIDRLRATMFSNAARPKARIELYEDCNGRPGSLIRSYDATVTPIGTAFTGFTLYDVSALTPNLYLDAGAGGRTFWIVPVGVGEAGGNEQWFFATSRMQDVLGAPGAFLAPGLGYGQWTSVASLPCGCTDFAFRVEGRRCETFTGNAQALQPTTPTRVGVPVLESALASSLRAADDLVVKPFSELLVCYLSAIVYTNCDPVLGDFDLYDEQCAFPTGEPIYSAPFSRVTDLGSTITYDGKSLKAYRVEAFDLAWVLPGGKSYAIGVGLMGSGSLNQRGLWAFADDCASPGCGVRLSEAAVRVPTAPAYPGGPLPPPTWTGVSNTAYSGGVKRDMALVVAGTRFSRGCADGSAGGGGQTPACIADIDGSGSVNVADLFLFLDAWFAGCP